MSEKDCKNQKPHSPDAFLTPKNKARKKSIYNNLPKLGFSNLISENNKLIQKDNKPEETIN